MRQSRAAFLAAAPVLFAAACTYSVPDVVPADAAVSADRSAPDGDATPADTTTPADAVLPLDSPTLDAVVDGLETGPTDAATDAASDAASDAATDARPATDATSDSAAATLSCGQGLTCTAPEGCCATAPGGPSTTIYKCVDDLSSQCDVADETPITCDDDADCPMGEHCCGTKAQASGAQYAKVACAQTCALPDIPFCNPGAGNPCAFSGGPCIASQLLPGFYVCQVQ
jgi:hypothetical protein